MIQRGRKSAAASSITSPSPRATRLCPPSTLSEPERKIFESLVAAVSEDHFRQSDLPLLVSYVQAIDLDARASKELRKGAVANGKASPWLTVQEKATRAIVALSMRLRLSPQARNPNNLKISKPPPPPVPWEPYDEA